MPNVELHQKNKVTALTQDIDGVTLSIETPDGTHAQCARYVVTADGSRSPVRYTTDLEARSQVFRDHFLIADARMDVLFPNERWFWSDPPSHPDQLVLLYYQLDNIRRVDLQLGQDAGPAAEKQPERVILCAHALLGESVDSRLEWVNVYTFSRKHIDRFRHSRVFLIDDAAHRMSPFGACGTDNGLQDTENLTWELHMVLIGDALDTLLDAYTSEYEFAADDNIRHFTRSTDSITPKNAVSRLSRDVTLRLAKHYPFV